MGMSSSPKGSSRIFFTDRLPVGLWNTFSTWKVLEISCMSNRSSGSWDSSPVPSRGRPLVPVMPSSRRAYSYSLPSSVYLDSFG